MTRFLDLIIGKPRAILAITAFMALAGLYFYLSIPRESSPDIDMPVFTIAIAQNGISAEDAERLLVKPVETALRGLNGLKELTAVASPGRASLVVEFDIRADHAEAFAALREKISAARALLPADAEEPLIEETNLSLLPVMTVALSGTLPERTLQRQARALKERIEAIPDVLRADLAGNRPEVLEVVLDPARLQTYAISEAELVALVTQNNRLVAAGNVDTGGGRFSVKVPGLFDSEKDILSLPVKVSQQGVVTLGDIAEIRRTFKDATSFSRVNGRPAVVLQIVKRPGANIVDTNAAVRTAVTEATRGWPQTIRTDILFDQSRLVYEILGSLEGNIISAVVLVMLVTVATLGFRSSFLVGLSIPLSFLIGFLFIGLTGTSMNRMVMFGLVLTVGIVVDGATILVEYADREMARGVGRAAAYRLAARSMFWPVTASTATAFVVYLPMLFWPGVAGKFMSALPVTVIFVLAASLFTALFVLPALGGLERRGKGRPALLVRQPEGSRPLTAQARIALSARGLVPEQPLTMERVDPNPKPRSLHGSIGASGPLSHGERDRVRGCAPSIVRTPSPPPSPHGRGSAPHPWKRLQLDREAAFHSEGSANRPVPGGALDRPLPPPPDSGEISGWVGRYIDLLHSAIRQPFTVLAMTAGLIVVVLVAYGMFNSGAEFFVDTEPEEAVVQISARGNLSAQEELELVKTVEAEVMKVAGLRALLTVSGAQSGSSGWGGQGGMRSDQIGQITIAFDDYDKRPKGHTLIQQLRERTAGIPGVQVEVKKRETGPPVGKPLRLDVSSHDRNTAIAAAATIRKRLDADAQLRDVEDSRPLPGIAWNLQVDREQAARYGADIASVGAAIQMITHGVLIGKFRPADAEDEIDIRARFPQDERSLSALDQLTVRTPNGVVPISNFVDRKPQAETGERLRKNRRYTVTVAANVVEGVRGGAKRAELRAWLDTQSWAQGVGFRFRGSGEDEQEASTFLSQAMLAALFLIFVILVAQFDSFYQTFITLLTVPLSVVGVLIGMLLTGQTFSVIMTSTGLLALTGVVVSNAIILIDTFNSYRTVGVDPITAVLRTCAERIRPVALTTLTTLVGLLPMALQMNINVLTLSVEYGSITSVWWVQFATALLFGLTFSTLLTLILVPTLLAAPTVLRQRWGGWKRSTIDRTAQDIEAEERSLVGRGR